MSLAKKLWMTTGDSSGGSGAYVDGVFSTYVYKGNDANRSFVTGQNLLADGGVVWTKGRSGTFGGTDHYLFHTERGSDIFLSTNTANGQGAFTAGTSVRSFNNDGFSLGTSPYVNGSVTEYVSWVFKNAPKFYGHRVVTKSVDSNASVSFPELGELGMVRVKSISGTGSWYVWHRSLPSGQLLVGETTAAAATLWHVTVSGTTVTLVNGAIVDGTYLVEAFAHDASADGIIQCRGWSTPSADVNLGWEPQFLIWKCATSTGGWEMLDNMRGFGSTPSGIEYLEANSNGAAFTSTNPTVTATGFKAGGGSGIFIYLAIRRPNKPPTTGTQVYNAIARTGTGAAATVTGVGFAPDALLSHLRNNAGGVTFDSCFVDRLRGANATGALGIFGTSTGGEWGADSTSYCNFTMDGIYIGGQDGVANKSGVTYLNHFFRRAAGFMDIVCDTGTGAAHAITHNLTKAPELIIRKSRSAATQWEVWHSALATTEKLVLNSNAAKATDTAAWNSTLPTATQFTVGTGTNVNANTTTFVTYLFATLAGISKVGSYSGNGGTQTIPCGFTTGSRFILIRRIDNTGDWFVWDTTRGITPTTDPHLSLNTIAVEVTTDDSIDQDASGFVVNQNAATNINALGGNYLFLAIA